jgi:predicted HNH restriction endonuclease
LNRYSHGQPYLEVHHINELGKGGDDTPQNVAAICPNCHARVTHGQDASKFNNELLSKILKKEEELEK